LHSTAFFMDHPPPSPAARPSTPELRAADTLPVAMLLSVAGGSIDAFVYLNHGHVFAAAVTGDAVLFGVGVLQHHLNSALRNLVPIASLFAGRMLQQAIGRYFVAVVLLCEIFGLFAASWLPGSFPDMAFVTVVSFFAATQVAIFRSEDGNRYNSTFITADLRTATDGLFEALKPASRHRGLNKARQLGLILLSFLAGAVAGALLLPRIFNRTLWFSDLPLWAALAIVLYRTRASQNDAPGR
jgi:uncharacterized membrane protein YoaK (UPF0700 family)